MYPQRHIFGIHFLFVIMIETYIQSKFWLIMAFGVLWRGVSLKVKLIFLSSKQNYCINMQTQVIEMSTLNKVSFIHYICIYVMATIRKFKNMDEKHQLKKN